MPVSKMHVHAIVFQLIDSLGGKVRPQHDEEGVEEHREFTAHFQQLKSFYREATNT